MRPWLNLGMTAGMALGMSPATVRAEEPRFGAQVHLSSAVSGQLKDQVDRQLGVGGGIHMTIPLGGPHVIRPRIDYSMFPEATRNAPLDRLKTKVSFLNAGADYLYTLHGRAEGFYLIGGIFLSHSRRELASSAFGDQGTATSNKPGAALGLGFSLNRSFGAELRFLSSSSNPNSSSGGFGTANLLEGGVTFRF